MPLTARGQPDRPDPPGYDAFTHLLHRLAPDPATRWAEAAPLVRREHGILVLDDSTLSGYALRAGALCWSS